MVGRIIAAILFGGLFLHLAFPAPIRFRRGILAPQEPRQTLLTRDIAPWEYEGFEITPLAAWESQVRVLSSKHYWFGKQSAISPVDIAAGWGPMSDADVFTQLSIRQGMRFFFWSAQEIPIPVDEIVSHSSNFHLIPSTEKIRDRLLRLEADDVVFLKGYLVAASDGAGWDWESSLTRNDTGNGACELIWVEEALRS